MRVEITRGQRDALAKMASEPGWAFAGKIVADFDAAQAALARNRDAVALARASCPDDLDFDDDPAVSEFRGGAWVSAWVRVDGADVVVERAPSSGLPPDNVIPGGIRPSA